MSTHQNKFCEIQKAIIECRKCPRLVEWREKVARERVRRFQNEEYWGRPLPAFGAEDASLIVIGLAPAAHGGNRTGRMFTGDSSGDWLYEAMARYGFANQPHATHRNDGLHLFDCLITAAVRCAPPQNKPLPDEMENCRTYLRAELQLLKSKRVVVALGQIGFKAFLKAWLENGGLLPSPKPVFKHGGEWVLPGGLVLIASYHPSRQNTQTGKLTRSMLQAVFRKARHILNREEPSCRDI